MEKQCRTSVLIALGTLLAVPLVAQADSRSFQDGVAPSTTYAGTRDTKIKSDATGNHGTVTNLEIDGSPDYSVLLKWDIASVPAGSTITAASLVVNATDAGHSYQIYEMKRNWTETGATWAQYAAGAAWQAAGASGANDRGTASLGSFGGASGVRTFALNATGVALVQRWLDTPGTNFGVIVQEYSMSDGFDFNSREVTTAANRPKLVVTYTPLGGATPTPTPGTGPTATPTPTRTPTPTPAPGNITTVCFIGDSGVGSNASSAHNTCIAGGAQAIVHMGDLDYQNSPTNWENFINSKVGQSFPYFYVLGNHDTANASGYRANAEARFNRLGITWSGALTSHCVFDWRGIRFIMTTPGLGDSTAATYIRDQAAATTAPWVLSIFHEQMAKMQVGTKGDATGWPVYEEGRAQGVTSWNGHEHSYGRTQLLSDVDLQTVADNTSPYTITKGTSIVVQTGAGGNSLRAFGPWANEPYWAAKYNLNYGVNLCTFGAGGDPRRADCVFRDIGGVDRDSWTMFSQR
jgi:hypothetical protein